MGRLASGTYFSRYTLENLDTRKQIRPTSSHIPFPLIYLSFDSLQSEIVTDF